MSSSFKYTAGLNNVGSYQVSGIPFCSSSINCVSSVVKVSFPFVTKWVLIRNNSSTASQDLKVGFSENGVNGIGGENYFIINNVTSADRASVISPLPLKLSEIYLKGSSDAEVVAGLTNIPVERINNISPDGTNWSGSYGGIG